jgi:hypothetical protein
MSAPCSTLIVLNLTSQICVSTTAIALAAIAVLLMVYDCYLVKRIAVSAVLI